jgi:rhodanese-related sulfurtransferase
MLIATVAYRRYYPVKGISYIEESKVKDDITILDIRDYNEAEKGSSTVSVNIPYAYMKRYYQDIPNTKLHVVAADQLELNLGLRYLKVKGFEVTSYSLKKSQWNTKQKGDMCYEIR